MVCAACAIAGIYEMCYCKSYDSRAFNHRHQYRPIPKNYITLASIKMLFELLRGRFRPIVSIEGIISNPGKNYHDLIQQNFYELILAILHIGGGNICNEIRRVLGTIRNNKDRYADYSDVECFMRMFIVAQVQHGQGLALDFPEAPLVEASIGRLVTIDGKVKTIMDEPFVLEILRNYFHEMDPQFSRQ
ncbi:hypothetical protein BGX27_006607 [Mortierella sp. AM989]|nr:hypothetical protein BGX27_006607 [Mortierella sp. AM989]